jgi:hypothetical protein
MVSETTNTLLAGIIAGWIVAVTQPIIKPIVDFLHNKCKIPKIVTYILLNILWLVAMMASVVKVYG